MERTIAAIATPLGAGGIAVIRMSGAQAVDIAARVYRGSASLDAVPTHTVHYGHIVAADGAVLDEVLVTVMRAPHTFTREDVVEIGTHGGMTASRLVLDRLIEAGAYPAEAGEFTKRAFLNGRIDLSQAEAVIDIISAKTKTAQQNAEAQLAGALSMRIDALREQLVSLAARMQVAIDYPDEDLEDITIEEIGSICRGTLSEVHKLLATADEGRILRDGIATAIIGKPNVGKSSILNMLAREEKAIVTEIAGTTRDVVEEYVNLGGVALRLLDTAGIRDTENIVEKIGVDKSKQSAETADLIFVVIDGARGMDAEDEQILRLTRDKKCIVIINKSDLGADKTLRMVREAEPDKPVMAVSAKTGEGFDALTAEIAKLYRFGEIGQGDAVVITNARHRAALSRAAEALSRAADALSAGTPQDIASIDIHAAMEALGEITGASVTDDIVENIFHNFCVGK